MNQRNTELSKSTNMNEIERQTYITNKPDLAKELVTSGIILQDQINMIEQVLSTVSAPAEDQEQVSDAMLISTTYGNN